MLNISFNFSLNIKETNLMEMKIYINNLMENENLY